MNVHEEMSHETEDHRDISDNCHPVSVFGKAAENAGKFENVTGITVLKVDRYFSEKVLC